MKGGKEETGRREGESGNLDGLSRIKMISKAG
jgi:hypothetical protein